RTLAPDSRRRSSLHVRDVHTEYVTERDPDERGQSPNDNASTGMEILRTLRTELDELEYRPGASFDRLLGGLRGPDEITHALADFITLFDRFSVREGFLRPNSFFFVGETLENARIPSGGKRFRLLAPIARASEKFVGGKPTISSDATD